MPVEPRRRLLRREALLGGLVAAAVAAIVMALVIASDGRQSLFRNDAEFYWLVARDPFADGAVFAPYAYETGDAYRYGRILFPLVAWLLVLGRESLVQWSLMAVGVVMFGATVAVSWEWCQRRVGEGRRSLAVLLVPAMWFSLVLAVSEPLVFALILIVYLLYEDERRGLALVSAAFLLLAREAAVVLLAPLAVRDLAARQWRRAASWALTAVPMIAWWTWVRVRVGEWPFADSSVSRREALGWPFEGVVAVVDEGARAAHFLAFGLGVVTFAAAIWVFTRRRWFPFAYGALAAAIVIPFFGPNAWRHPGEAIRLLGPAQLLVVLTLATDAGTRVRARDPVVT